MLAHCLTCLALARIDLDGNCDDCADRIWCRRVLTRAAARKGNRISWGLR